MPTFPRTVYPVNPGEIEVPQPLAVVTARGVGQVRAEDRLGGVWSERWSALPLLDTDVRELLATIRYFKQRGIIFDIVHLTLPGSGQSPNGTGTSGVKVKGGSQSGLSVVTDGWPTTTSNVVRAGDVISIAGINQIFEIRAAANSDGSGDATLLINPAILAGSEPADNADVTTTGVTLRARIESTTMPDSKPAGPTVGHLIGLEVTFRMMP